VSGDRRTYVVTGSASGIGAATVRLLEAGGARVVGVDLRDAEVVADLGTAAGRDALVGGVRGAAGDVVDGVIACAGVGGRSAPEPIVRINYFGAVATLSGIRPLLERSSAPRAVAIASAAVLLERDEGLVDLCLAADEEGAVRRAVDQPTTTSSPSSGAYSSVKTALARWIRRQSVLPEWAGQGITLNAIGPGVIETPMTRDMMATPESRAAFFEVMPHPLGMGRPEDVAALLTWLTSVESRYVTGQLILIDGGLDASRRGDDIW
jgi:NAD(P)-dependent dehydrogenase (short-subunit alcohol dehydrogenase family)